LNCGVNVSLLLLELVDDVFGCVDVDECCLLPSEVQIPTYNSYNPSKSLGVASSVIFSRGSPHQVKDFLFQRFKPLTAHPDFIPFMRCPLSTANRILNLQGLLA